MPPPSTIHRNPPDEVIYDLSIRNQVTVTLPVGSTWTSGLHWHETHTEYLQLVKGRIRVRLGDTVQIISVAPESGHRHPSPPEIRVDKGVWHEWSRAEPESEEEVVVIERTDPADGEKAIFFWNLNGVILEAQRATGPGFLPGRLAGPWIGLWVTLSLFAIFHTLDNFPVLLGARDAALRRGFIQRDSWGDGWLSWLEARYSHGLLRIASIVAWITGVGAVRLRFTPVKEYEAWVRLKEGKRLQ